MLSGRTDVWAVHRGRDEKDTMFAQPRILGGSAQRHSGPLIGKLPVSDESSTRIADDFSSCHTVGHVKPDRWAQRELWENTQIPTSPNESRFRKKSKRQTWLVEICVSTELTNLEDDSSAVAKECQEAWEPLRKLSLLRICKQR